MRRYNFVRPLLIILVAFATNNIVSFICYSFGVDKETTESVALGAMVLAALFTYMRLTRNQRRK